MRITHIVGILLITVLLAGCNTQGTQTPPVENTTPVHTYQPQLTELTVQTIVDEFNIIDKIYETNWKEEQLTNFMIPSENIDGATTDLAVLRAQLIGTNDTLLTNLVDARIAMLKSQRAYYRSMELDPRGLQSVKLTTVNGTLAVDATKLQKPDCDQQANYLAATYEQEKAMKEGHKFLNLMDDVLQRDIPARDIIGVNDERPLFYKSPLGTVRQAFETQRLILGLFCD